jgi:sulfur relay protein TusB/DsrH
MRSTCMCWFRDLVARGFDPAAVIAGVQTIDYDGFVDLTIAKRSVQSWL